MPEPLRDQLGRPLTDLRVSVTDRCNLRCACCMPAGEFEERFLPCGELLSFEEITRCVRLATRLGVRRVRITGGEPLVRRDIGELFAMLRQLPGGVDLSMTTNGVLLSRLAYLDGGGEIGVITSVSTPFCRDCSRLRLAADGTLYPCLFASSGLELKKKMRAGADDDRIIDLMTRMWRSRDDRYSELRSSMSSAALPLRAEMYQNGG